MVHSMTAFARNSVQDVWGSATWEIRVVNHRYFDCIIKLPEAFRSFEPNIRLQLQQQLQRGRVDCYLKFVPSDQDKARLELNTNLVAELTNVMEQMKDYVPLAPVDPMRILSWPQVLKTGEVNIGPVQEIVMQLFEKTLAEAIAARKREGTVLAQLLHEKLKSMSMIVNQVKTKMPQLLADQRMKIVKRLEEVVNGFEPSRLEQEMVYFAQKIDVTEELERLEVHIQEVQRILDIGNNEGKRLDFLMQELHRETNTLGSKSVDIAVTHASVELKVLIEQMREQVQNIV